MKSALCGILKGERTVGKRIAALLMSLCLLAGCSSDAAPSPSREATATLDWFVDFSWFTAAWGENHVTQAITQQTGTEVVFSSPVGNENETLDAMLQGERLPDLITLGWWMPQVGELIESGRVYPLEELAQRYAPEFFEAASPEVLDWYRQDDGQVYCYPSASSSPAAYADGAIAPSNQTFLVRKDLYEALGSPDMTTPEGFADALRRAKETFPTVNGYPLLTMGCGEFNERGCSSFSEHLRDLLALPQERDGQAVDWQTDPEYITWLKTFRELIAEGTIGPNILLDKRQQVSEKLLRGQYFCLIYQWSDMEAEQRQLYYENPKGSYIAVDGPKNSAGDNHALSGVGMNGWTVTFITRDCRDPEKAIELMSFLMSEEGQKLTALGVEGLDYNWEDGVAVPSQEAENLLRQDYPAYVATIGADNNYWMLLDNTIQSQWQTASDPALEQLRVWALSYTVDNTPYEVAFPPASEAEIINQRAEQLWGETLPRLLLAASEEEFDRLISQYVEQRAQLGWDKLQQAKTQQYEINKERLAVIASQQGGEA